jgi:hypothetical protein
MGVFHGDIRGRFLSSNRWRDFELLAPVVYHGSGAFEIIVPVGFVTDFASVPRPFWSFLPPYGPWTRAAIVHDFLWRKIWTGDPHPHAPTTEAAAMIFYLCLKDTGVKPFTAALFWLSVASFAMVKRTFHKLP